MKKLLLVLLFAPLLTYSQNALTYTEVIQAEGVSKDELFNRAKRWFNEAYKNSQKVIQIQDKVEGEISGKAAISYVSRVFSGSENTKGVIRYNVNIYLKEGKYKYEITSFVHEANKAYSFGLITTDEDYPNKMAGTFKGWQNNVWEDLKRNCKNEVDSLIPSLKEAMNKKSQNESDW